MEPNSSMPQSAGAIKNVTKIELLIAGLVIVGAIVGAVYYQSNRQDLNTNENWAEEFDALDEFGQPQIAPNTSVVWKDKPVQLLDLKILGPYKDSNYSADAPYYPTGAVYYDLGTNGANKIILVNAAGEGMGGPSAFFFEEISNGYKFMKGMSAQGFLYTGDNPGYQLSPKILETDEKTYYKGLVGPKNITFQGLKLTRGDYEEPSQPFDNVYGTPAMPVRKITTLSEGDLYLWEKPVEDFFIRYYILKLPSGLYTRYSPQYDFYSDISVPQITWNDGSKNKDTFRQDANLGGCGNPGGFISSTRTLSDSALKPVGITSTGETIYGFKDIQDPINKFFYDMGGRKYNQQTGSYEELSIEEWTDLHGIIIYKNALGHHVIFTNDNYGSGAECGKPVIYLYPTETTHVSVQVGADVTKSEPTYMDGGKDGKQKGWRVTAEPNGALTMADGSKYESLFWEGLGHGMYPEITEGKIVAKSDVEATLISDLKKLGLNEKESADFLEFWLERMPETPYTRLTWFTTSELDVLAPLAIRPTPQSVIRVFLDFEGLEKSAAATASATLKPQTLTSIPRKGFTVVEWGGLLRNGL